MKLSKKSQKKIGAQNDTVPNSDQAITDYFKVRFQPKDAQPALEDGAPRLTPLTDLIAARRQLTDAGSNLVQLRGEMHDWRTEMRADWQQLQERQLQLRDSFLRFNHFVKENHDKRQRAKAKIEKEQKTQQQLNEEIARMRDQVKYLSKVEQQLDDQVKEYQIYKDFLVQAANQTPNFTDIQDILSRYEILAETRSELGMQQAAALTSVQEAREQLTDAAGAQVQIMMGLHTELAALRVRQHNLETQVTKWESILARVRAFAADKTIQVQQVRNSCWDLYKTLCRMRKEPVSIAESNTEHQLAYISRRIQELAKVTRIASKKSETHLPASNAHTATSSI